MGTHNIGFYQELTKNYHLIVINYYQMLPVSGLLSFLSNSTKAKHPTTITYMQQDAEQVTAQLRQQKYWAWTKC